MKTKSTLLKISIIFIVIMILVSSTFCSYAGGASVMSDYDFTSPKQFDNTDQSKLSTFSKNLQNRVETLSDNILGSILGILQIVTLAMAIIMLIVYGIRYVSGHNADDKGKIKNIVSRNYIIGIVLLFGASAILSLAYNMVNDILVM